MQDDELRRHAARERAAGKLYPGCRVEVVDRIVFKPAKYGRLKSELESYTLNKLALWKHPSSTGPALARQWRERRKETTFKEELDRHKGPVLFRGTQATVIAVLLDVPCELTGRRPWALLLSDSGELGWCYALDGLRLLHEFSSPAGGV